MNFRSLTANGSGLGVCLAFTSATRRSLCCRLCCRFCRFRVVVPKTNENHMWDVMAHWLRRLLSTGGSWVRLPLWPSRRDLGQVLYLQLPVRFGVKLRYSIRAVVGSAS